MATKKKAQTRWHDGTTPLEELGEAEQVAHRIVAAFPDLSPSVERIMSAELEDAERVNALTAFERSLSQAGDPNRDPRVAIEAARSHAS